MTQNRFVVATFLGAAALFYTTRAVAKSCEPTHGNEMMEWVTRDLGRQSRELATADYNTRIYNYLLLGYENLNSRSESFRAALDAIDKRIAVAEASAPAAQIEQALNRERSATELLNDLLMASSELESIKRKHSLMVKRPSEVEFVLDGLQHVGRASLLASIKDFGLPGQEQLLARYGAFVSVEVTPNGYRLEAKPTNPDMYDFILQAALASSGNDNSGWIYGFYMMVRRGVNDAECERRLDRQTRKLKEAARLVPEKLIQPREQYALFASIYDAQLIEFADYSNKFKTLITELEARWKQLFAYNAGRAAVAEAILTAETVSRLREQYERDADVKGMFKNFALADVAKDLTNLRTQLITARWRMRALCNDVNGFYTVEKQHDLLAYSTAIVTLLSEQSVYAPLQKILDATKRDIEDARIHMENLKSGLSSRSCNEAGTDLARDLDSPIWEKSNIVDLLKRRSEWETFAAADLGGADARSLLTDAAAEPPAFSAYCNLVSAGGAYTCGVVGWPFSGSFNSSDPRNGVYLSVNDGGYRSDSRKLSDKIYEARENVEQRIADLRARYEGPKSAAPQWITKNSVSLEQNRSAESAKRTAGTTQWNNFAVQHAPALSTARQEIDRFLNSGDGLSGSQVLARRVGAAALELPDLPAGKVPHDAPNVTGVTAVDRVFGSTRPVNAREIYREQLKAQAALTDAGVANISTMALRTAERFGNGQAQKFCKELVLDSASLRYVEAGELSTLTLAAVDESGKLSRVPIADSRNLPTQTLIARAQAFDKAVEVHAGKRAAAKATDYENEHDAAGRDSILIASGMYEGLAAEVFFGGDPIGGQQLLNAAITLLDLAVSFSPYGLGRDLYEAALGVDLFSREPLDAFGRLTAIFGVVTGGFGDEPIKLARTFNRVYKLEETVANTELIVKSVNKWNSHNVTWGEDSWHFFDRLRERGISQEKVKAVLDSPTSSVFWSYKNRSISYYENAPAGAKRIMVAVDPWTGNVKTTFELKKADAKIGRGFWVRRARGMPNFRRLPSRTSLP